MIIFNPLVRPFDIGDKITVEGMEYAGTMIVHQVQLFRTIAIGIDGKYHSIPNTTLLIKEVANLHRSNDYTIHSFIQIGEETPGYKVVALKEAILKYCNERKHVSFQNPQSIKYNSIICLTITFPDIQR